MVRVPAAVNGARRIPSQIPLHGIGAGTGRGPPRSSLTRPQRRACGRPAEGRRACLRLAQTRESGREMGNRAVITTKKRDLGVYLHWNDGWDSVEANSYGPGEGGAVERRRGWRLMLASTARSSTTGGCLPLSSASTRVTPGLPSATGAVARRGGAVRALRVHARSARGGHRGGLGGRGGV